MVRSEKHQARMLATGKCDQPSCSLFQDESAHLNYQLNDSKDGQSESNFPGREKKISITPYAVQKLL